MPTAEALDEVLDLRLNQLGELFAEKAYQVDERIGNDPFAKVHKTVYAMKETRRHMEVQRTALYMASKGIDHAIIDRYVEKAVSVTRAGYGHGYNSPGVGGIFATPMMPDIINAMQLPTDGLDAMLPEIPVQETNPLYGIITGQMAGTGSAPANDCANWGVAGLTKICRQVATLGRVGVSSDPVNIERFGQLIDRADFQDYRLVGDPLAAPSKDNVPGLPGISLANGSNFLNSEFAKIMRELEVEAIRRFAPDVWTSNPASSADAWHTAWYRGLQILVNTGQQDSVTQTTCPKADSIIIDFATNPSGNNISSTAAAASTLVDVISELWYVMNRIASEAGLQPVEWVFAMTPEAFRELTAAWPCSYLTNRCLTATAGTPNQVQASDQLAMREDMRKGKFLWIDAQQVPVVVDSTIPQTQGTGAAGAGSFLSDIWLLPMTVRGRFPVLTKTYFDFNSRFGAAEGLRALGPLAYGMNVSPDGKFIYNLEKTGTCFQLSATKRPGLVNRAPFLSARVKNVLIKPRIVTPSWNPGAASFYLNGGITVGQAPSFYNPTTAG